jgi:membrane protein DedA with SNARE-associated domain
MGAFETFLREYAAYGYPVLFVGVLLENAGVPVPGETAVLVAGFLASQGHFQIVWVILLTVVAAVIGDNLGFWLGHRWARPRLQSGRRFLFLTPTTLKHAEGYFERYGLWTVFFARFITGLRVVGALAAGTAGMAWPRFLVANAGGALAWATTMSLLGYFFGNSLELLHKYLGGGGLILLACVVLLVGLPLLLRRFRKVQPGLWQRVLRAQVWQGVAAAVLEVVCVALLVFVASPTRDPAAYHGRRVDQTVEEWVDPARHAAPLGIALARWGGYTGGLPTVLVVTALMLVQLWYARRPWREYVALVGALIVSEGVGLILLGLLRHRGVEPEYTLVWPYGFAGLAPLRAVAVFGMAAAQVGRQNPTWGRLARMVALLLVLFIGISAVWAGEQRFTQVLLECVAGGVVLFAGLWWLEGHGHLLPLNGEQGPGEASPSPAPVEGHSGPAPSR